MSRYTKCSTTLSVSTHERPATPRYAFNVTPHEITWLKMWVQPKSQIHILLIFDTFKEDSLCLDSITSYCVKTHSSNPVVCLFSFSQDIQHLQRFSSVSWCRVPVCLLWWGDLLPQIPHPVPVLQRLPLLLVRQLCDGPGPGHSVGSLRLVLLGLQKAGWYSLLSHLLLTGTSPPVSHIYICVCSISLCVCGSTPHFF